MTADVCIFVDKPGCYVLIVLLLRVQFVREDVNLYIRGPVVKVLFSEKGSRFRTNMDKRMDFSKIKLVKACLLNE